MASKAVKYSLVMTTPFSSQKWDVNSKEESRIRRSVTFRAKAALFVGVVIAVVIVAVVIVCVVLPKYYEEQFWPRSTSAAPMGRYQRAAVSTGAAPCAPIGRRIMERGGSAVDAAIATLTCMGANNPQSSGLGGGFLMLYYNRTEKRAYYLDAREVAPRKATEDMFRGNATLAGEGGLSIATPGELAGFWEAHRQFGRLPWEELFPPTIDMCRQGIEANAHFVKSVAKKLELIKQFPDLRKVFLKDGEEPYKLGEKILRTDLADTLQVIAREQMKALHGPSELATKFLQDLKNAGSLIDEKDLLSYSPRMREPAQVVLRGNHTLYGSGIPGSGALLAFMMSVLDGYSDLTKNVTEERGRARLFYHRLIETMKFGYAHRSHLEDEDSKEVLELVEKLTSRRYADEVRAKIDDRMTFDNLSHYFEAMGYTEDHGTAHLSIVAPDGDAVAITSTVNQYFGSKVLSPSTGIVLNDEMDDFSSPKITNSFGLPPQTTNRIKPGRRPMSSMAPTILVDANGDVRMVVGGNGGTTITSGILQVMVRNFFLDENIKQSIDAPRIHHQLTPNVLQYEQRFPEVLLEDLRKFGHKTKSWGMSMMSVIMGIERDKDGYLYANADYRKNGAVDGF